MSTDGTDLRWRTRAEPVLRPFPLPQSQPPARGWPFAFISELFTSWSATNEPPTSPVAVAPLQPRRPVSLKLTIPGTAQSSQAAPPQSPSSYSRSIPRDRKSLVGPRRYPSSSRSRMLHRTSTSTTNASSPILSAPHPAPVVGLSVLPPELWRRILRFATQVPRLQPSSPSETTNIEFLPPHIEPLHLRRTKRNLVLVCSLFRTLATPFLYEYLVPENSKQTTGLLKLFAARPEFGGYVRRIAFAVVGYAHDVHVHMSCIREVLHRTPGVASAHVLYLSSNGARSGLPEVLTTVEHGETGWRWKALEWTDGSVNEPRAMDRFLGQCPLLEQLTLTGNVVAPLPLPAPTHRRWSSEPLRPRGSNLTLHSLHRLVLRDTHPATLALVASWTLPALTHLTLILNSAVSFGAAHALIARYARSLKFLRLEARHLPCEHVTSLLALCTEVEAIVVPLGTLLPRMERLQTLGWVRGMVTYGMEDLDMLDQRRLPMLETLVAVESTRFALSRREIAQFNMQFGRRLMWQDCNGDLVD